MMLLQSKVCCCTGAGIVGNTVIGRIPEPDAPDELSIVLSMCTKYSLSRCVWVSTHINIMHFHHVSLKAPHMLG